MYGLLFIYASNFVLRTFLIFIEDFGAQNIHIKQANKFVALFFV